MEIALCTPLSSPLHHVRLHVGFGDLLQLLLVFLYLFVLVLYYLVLAGELCIQAHRLVGEVLNLSVEVLLLEFKFPLKVGVLP